jgi:hypothetical protein
MPASRSSKTEIRKMQSEVVVAVVVVVVAVVKKKIVSTVKHSYSPPPFKLFTIDSVLCSV